MEQRPLFDMPTFNTARPVKEAMARAAGASGLSVEELAHRMNRLADRYGVRLTKGNGSGVSVALLEKWINPNDVRQPPYHALPIFCAVTGDHGPLDELVRPLNRRMVGPDDEKKLRWAEAKWRIREAAREVRRIEGTLDGGAR